MKPGIASKAPTVEALIKLRAEKRPLSPAPAPAAPPAEAGGDAEQSPKKSYAAAASAASPPKHKARVEPGNGQGAPGVLPPGAPRQQ